MPEPPADDARTRTAAPHPAPAPPTASGSTAPQHDGPPGDTPRFARPSHPGDVGRLGRYRVVRRLGAGGMGAVYLGHDDVLDRPVALKVMLPRFAADARAAARFLREARSAAAVSSPHVVAVLDVDEVAGAPFIAMELLRGVPLDRYLSAHPRLAVSQVVRLGMEAARGLAAAHAAGLVHRDVKPSNLFLESPHGRVKILDFGLARAADETAEDGGVTRTGQVVGTPAYMSPEQARGVPVDHRTDLFSLGVVLYKLCTGRQPFRGPNPLAVALAVGTEEPTSVRELNPDVPPPLAALVHRLMAKSPGDRPQTAIEVHAALVAVETELTVPEAAAVGDETEPEYVPIAVPVSPDEGWTAPADEPDPPAPAARRGFPWLVAGSSVAALLAVGVLLVLLDRFRPKPEVALRPEPPAPKTPDPPRLFNGTDLTGWDAAPGWRVENGELVGTFPKGTRLQDTHLVTRQVYRDFELSFQFKYTGPPGSGAAVGFRIGPGVASLRNAPGCELGVESPDLWIGARPLKKAAPAACGPVRADVYHHVVVRCADRRVAVTIDKQTAHDEEYVIPAEGRIDWHVNLGAEHHAELRVRGVRFRELTPVPPEDPDRDAARLVVAAGGAVHLVGSPAGIDKAAAIPADPFRVRVVGLPLTHPASDADIDLLADLPDLEVISFRAGNVTAAGLERLSRFPAAKNYTAVMLSGDLLTPEAVPHFARFTSLRAARFGYTTVTAAGLAELDRHRPNLASLALEWAKFGDDELAALKAFKQLTAMTLTRGQFTPAGVGHLADLPAGLRELHLRDAGWADDALAEFAKLPHLTALGLMLTGVSEDAAVKVAEARGLKRLFISESTPEATRDRIARLRERLPGCYVGPFPGLAAPGLPTFRTLDPAWAAGVAKMPPEEQVKAVGFELARRNPQFDPATLKATVTPAGVEGLKISPRFVTDLTPVRALPVLTVLDCNTDTYEHGSIADLTALDGLPLRELRLHHNVGITDLTPLAGMPLEILRLSGCDRLTDVAPLTGAPLKWVQLDPGRVKDLSPLGRCRSLEEVDLLRQVGKLTPGHGIDALRALPNLKHIDGIPAAEFFPGWDRRKDLSKSPGPRNVIAAHTGIARWAGFDADGKRLVTAGFNDGKIQVWDAAGNNLWTSAGSFLHANAAEFLPGTDLVVAGYADGLRFWGVRTGKQDGGLLGTGGSSELSVSPDGKAVVANPAPAGPFSRYAVGARAALPPALAGHTAAVSYSSFSPDGKFLVTGGHEPDNSVRVWDLENGKEVARHTAARMICSVQFSPDGKSVLFVAGHHEVGLFDWRAKKVTRTLRYFQHIQAVYGPGGKHILLAGTDGVVTVLDAETWSVVREGNGGVSGLWHVAVSPDGKTVATTHHDGTVRLWDWDTLLGKKP